MNQSVKETIEFLEGLLGLCYTHSYLPDPDKVHSLIYNLKLENMDLFDAWKEAMEEIEDEGERSKVA